MFSINLLRAIANNAGLDGAVVVNRVNQLKGKTEGYDANAEKYCDLLGCWNC